VIALGFEASSFRKPLEGFGFLVPRRERRLVAACTFVGTKFNFRAPKDKVLLRCFVNAALQDDDETVVHSVLEELGDMTGLTGRPTFSRIFRWPLSMPQYTVGHSQRMASIQIRLQKYPRLFLAGNAYDGIGVPDCIRTGRRLAESIVN
jgi:oxygen-dependent protoporphyrinogen oxidase